MTLIHLFPETVRRELIERLQLGIICGHEHLIGRRVEVELESCLKKGLLDLCRVTDSVLSNVLIETAAEKLIKLNAQKPAFCQKCAVLLDNRKEVRDQLRIRDDDGLAKQGAALGSADIEGVTEPRQIGKLNVVFRASESIGQPRTVHIQRNLMGSADCGNLLQFLKRVESSEFCRLRNIDHARHNHVIPVPILLGFTVVVNSSEETFRLVYQLLSTLTDFIAILLRNRNTLQALNQQSCRDPLTDALNRRGLNQFLDSWNGEGTFALISGDINGLKTTNDTLGHQAGDELIRAAVLLFRKFADRDHIFRTGGDEFLIIVEQADEQSTEMLVRSMREEMHTAELSVALGWVIQKGPITNRDALMTTADRRMYADKGQTYRRRYTDRTIKEEIE